MATAKWEIGVWNDWGKLREVMVGYPEATVVTDYHPSLNWMTEQMKREMEKNSGKVDADVFPENAKKLRKQIEDHVKILEDHGVTVHRALKYFPHPEEAHFLDEIQRGCMPFPGEDYFRVIGTNVILINALRPPFRRKQIYLVRPVLEPLLANSNARYVACPPPSPYYDEKDIYLENGDIVLDGRNVYVGFSGNSTSEAGIAWLQQYLGAEYTVWTVLKVKEAFHLGGMLNIPRPGLVFYYPELLPNGLPEPLKNYEKVEIKVAKDDRWCFGCNNLSLDEKTIVVPAEYEKVAAEYRKRGFTVITSNYDMTIEYGSGPKCLTAVLRRDP